MISKEEYKLRREILQKFVNKINLDAFLVSQPDSIYYLTGATYKAQERPFFIIIWKDREPTFLVPKLEESHMKKAEIGDVKAYWEFPAPIGEGWNNILQNAIKDIKILGVEPGISVENFMKLKDKDIELMSLPIVDEQRLIKSPSEIEMIRQAARYADIGMKLMMNAAYFGISVLEMFSLARKVQLDVIKTTQFDPLNCEFLTATWPAPSSAMPHGVPPINGKLKEGPLAAMSFLRVNGYAAECERTFFLAKPTEKEMEIFNVVQEARKRVFDMIRAGVKCSEIDKAGMDYLKSEGYGEYLLHRTGHGIGLGNHEGPWIAAGSEHVLEENMVISVEPGIYIPKIGGFRHSDTVLIKKDGYEVLTHYPTDIQDLTILSSRILKKFKGKVIQKALGI